ncbi:MAG: nuclear transport factor 2 family protein, partial [Candidatus Desantisbacteria bacterium]
VSLITALQEGANAHKDIDAMVNLFTDDAVVTFAGLPPPNVFIGKEQIRTWQEMEFADNSHIECGNLKVSGNKVTFTLKVSSDSLVKLGVTPPALESTIEAVIQEGKFKSFTLTFDPESLAKLNPAPAKTEENMIRKAFIGTWQLVSRELPNGTILKPPQIAGMIIDTGKYNCISVIDSLDGKKLHLYSNAGIYEFSGSTIRGTDLLLADILQGSDGKYDTQSKKYEQKISVDGGKISFKLDYSEMISEMIIDGDTWTHTASGVFKDTWKKVE